MKKFIASMIYSCYLLPSLTYAQDMFNEPHIINTDANGTYCVYTADLDSDGDLDYIAGDAGSKNKI